MLCTVLQVLGRSLLSQVQNDSGVYLAELLLIYTQIETTRVLSTYMSKGHTIHEHGDTTSPPSYLKAKSSNDFITSVRMTT